MKCKRCVSGEEAKYRVYTELMEMKVCAACADEARRIGIAVEVLYDRVMIEKGENNGSRQSNASNKTFQSRFSSSSRFLAAQRF
jgi:hypothetical protein